MEISHYADNRILATPDNDDVYLLQASEKLWDKSRQLVKKLSGEAKWTEALYTAIDKLKSTELELARSQGKLPSPSMISNAGAFSTDFLARLARRFETSSAQPSALDPTKTKSFTSAFRKHN